MLWATCTGDERSKTNCGHEWPLELHKPPAPVYVPPPVYGPGTGVRPYYLDQVTCAGMQRAQAAASQCSSPEDAAKVVGAMASAEQKP